MKRVPMLDGWRGIAILLVLVDHIATMIRGTFPPPWLRLGQHGVTIFFVLSGYLITTGLIEAPIHLKRFYTRRFFRLMPAAWTFLAVLWLLSRVTGVPLTTPAEIAIWLMWVVGVLPATSGRFRWRSSSTWHGPAAWCWPAPLAAVGLRRAAHARWQSTDGCSGRILTGLA